MVSAAKIPLSRPYACSRIPRYNIYLIHPVFPDHIQSNANGSLFPAGVMPQFYKIGQIFRRNQQDMVHQDKQYEDGDQPIFNSSWFKYIMQNLV